MTPVKEIAQRLRALSAISSDRCSVVSTNAVLSYFKKPLLQLSEYPRTLMDMHYVLKDRGLRLKAIYAHLAKDRYTLADALAEFPKGVYFLQSSQHVMALINGKLTDTEGAGTRRQVLVWQAHKPSADELLKEDRDLKRARRLYPTKAAASIKVTFTLKNLTDEFYNGTPSGSIKGLLNMTDEEKWEYLKRAASRKELSIKIKIGTGQLRDQIELNDMIRKPCNFEFRVEPRVGYKLVTFQVSPK